MMNPLMKVEEGILDYVLGQGFVLGDEEGGPNGPHLVTTHQDLQPADVAAFHAANGFVVIQGHSGHGCTHKEYTLTGQEVGAVFAAGHHTRAYPDPPRGRLQGGALSGRFWS